MTLERCEHGRHPDVVCGECLLSEWAGQPVSVLPPPRELSMVEEARIEDLRAGRDERRAPDWDDAA